jgi:hypothetical protein
MKKALRILGFLLIYHVTMGQTYSEASAGVYFTPGTYNSHFADAFSFTSNPASLAGADHLLFGVFTENKWMLQALNSYMLASSFMLGGGGVGLALQKNGDADFNEQSLVIAYGKHLGRLDMGIDFEYQRDYAAGYKSVNFFSSGFGIRFQLNEKLTTGWQLGLPVSGTAGKINPERAPQFFRMGFGYYPMAGMLLTLQIEKESGQPVEITGYLVYRYGSHFNFLFGVNSLTGSVFIKTGWRKNGLDIQLCLLYEPFLGFSPALELLWENKKSEE